MAGKSLFTIALAPIFLTAAIGVAQAESFAQAVQQLPARLFDESLPAQPVGEWLRSNLPATYQLVWGEHPTDCGEGSGTMADRERDLPICAEVEIKEGNRLAGYLALLVGTGRQGLRREGAGLYFGYLEQDGKRSNLGKLRDLRRE